MHKVNRIIRFSTVKCKANNFKRFFFHYKTRLESEPIGSGMKIKNGCIKCYHVTYRQQTDRM